MCGTVCWPGGGSSSPGQGFRGDPGALRDGRRTGYKPAGGEPHRPTTGATRDAARHPWGQVNPDRPQMRRLGRRIASRGHGAGKSGQESISSAHGMGSLSARALPEAIGTPIRLMVWTCRTSVKTGSGWAQGCQSTGTPRGRSRQEEEGGRQLRSSTAARWPGLRGTRGRGEGHGGLETLIHPAGFQDRQGALGEVRELGGHFGRRPRSRLHSQGREDSGLGYRGRSRGRPPARLEQGLAAKAGQPSASTSRRAHFSEPAQDPSPSHPAYRRSAFPQGLPLAGQSSSPRPHLAGWVSRSRRLCSDFSGVVGT